MKKIVHYLTIPYSTSTHYIRKKAVYSAAFILLVLCIMLLIQGADIIVFGVQRADILVTLGFAAGFLSLFLLLRKGRLEICLNLLILGGVLRCLMLIRDPLPIQFYTTAILILLATAVVHIKGYQLYATYAVSWGLFLSKYLFYSPDQHTLSSDYNPRIQSLYSLMLLSLFMVMVHFTVRIIEREIRESIELTRLAETDTLTGIGNRRKFHQTVRTLEKHRQQENYSLILFDLDHFKRVNDEYGHDTGDLVLKEVADLINRAIRKDNALFRWGGEEFLILLPALSLEDLQATAERLRETVKNHTFVQGLSLTISLGISLGDTSSHLADLINKADQALYRAKEAGRNRVCT